MVRICSISGLRANTAPPLTPQEQARLLQKRKQTNDERRAAGDDPLPDEESLFDKKVGASWRLSMYPGREVVSSIHQRGDWVGVEGRY